MSLPLKKKLQYEKENAELIMNNHARKAEELAAALAATKGLPAQSDTDGASQGGGFAVEPGQYAPTVAGGQPRPIGMPPLGGGQDMQGYGEFDEETTRIRAERGCRAGGWSIEFSKKRALDEAFASIWI